MKPPARKESEIQRGILEYLRFRGVLAWKAGTGAMRAEYRGKPRFIQFGTKGVSDIIGMLPGGRFLAIEVKRPGKRPTWEQSEFLRAVREGGGQGWLAVSTHDVDLLLTGYLTAPSREGEHADHGQRQPVA